MDIELAVDLMEMAPHVDHVVLFSGDGDFRRLVDAVQRKGTRVTVVSTVESSPPMVADELRRQADHFIDLRDIQALIERDVRMHREEPPSDDIEEEDDLRREIALDGRPSAASPDLNNSSPPGRCAPTPVRLSGP